MTLNFGNETQTQQGGSTMNLAKTVQAGERINLSKQVGASVTKYAVGMSWNEKAGITADCDISIVLLGENGLVIPGLNGPNMPKCMCYYGQQSLPGVKSYGDNKTGNDSEVQTPTRNDEQIDVDFAALDPSVVEVLIIATTHSEVNGAPGQPLPFGRVAVPVLTIFNNTNPIAPVPLYTFELDEEASVATAVEVAKFYKKSGDWRYVSMADEVGQDPFGLNGIVAKYNIG
jgi:tellurium resistance protein TerD